MIGIEKISCIMSVTKARESEQGLNEKKSHREIGEGEELEGKVG